VAGFDSDTGEGRRRVRPVTVHALELQSHGAGAEMAILAVAAAAPEAFRSLADAGAGRHSTSPGLAPPRLRVKNVDLRIQLEELPSSSTARDPDYPV
jgi:hypothetical protein